MSSKLVRRIIIGVLIVLIAIQFIRPSRATPRVDPNGTFLMLENPPAEIADLIELACDDCHSYNTTYPWYANVAPISWMISNHVNEGREHLNFSEWGKYPNSKKVHKAEEAAEEVAEGHMPIDSYTWLHSSARLSAAQREQLRVYFEELKNARAGIPTMPSPTAPLPPTQ